MHVVLVMVCERSKKNKGWSSNAICYLCVLRDVQEIDGCKFETLFHIFGFWYYKIMVAGKIGDKWKAIEQFWFLLLESKIRRILRFEFLYVCLCESLVFYLDGSEHSVLYLDYMNESLDLFFSSDWLNFVLCLLFVGVLCNYLCA